MSATLLILTILAAFRLSFLITQERGPWSLSERLRSWVVNRCGPQSWQAEGIQCILCVSFWVALIVGSMALFIDTHSITLTPEQHLANATSALFRVFIMWHGVAGACLVLNNWLMRR